MGLKRSCTQYLEVFKEYNFLWENSRSDELQAFCAKKRPLEDYEAEIEKYDKTIKSIDALSAYRVIGT